MEEKAYSVYVLYSENFKRLYVGMTVCVERRIGEHNRGETHSTKHYRPWKLIYTEVVGTRRQARDKEKYYKSGCGREFVKQFIPR